MLLPSLAGYRRVWLPRDVMAGLAAGAVVIPQAMAYATIADLPVAVGLYTCILPMLVYALLGGSRAMSVSTTSTVATLTATTLVTAGVVSSAPDGLGALTTLTLLVGAILLLARLLRLGSLVENISGATVLGVQIGVGAIVAVGQVPTMLGETLDVSGEGLFAVIAAAIASVGTASVPTVALSAGSVAVLLLLRRFAPQVPGALIVAVGGILLVGLGHLDALGVALIDAVPTGMPRLGLPDLSVAGDLVPGALAIAVMAFLESAAVARTIRERSQPQIDSDRELLAMGAANVLGAFSAAMPAAGGFSQSAVNRGAGARTQLAGVVTAVLAILVALFLGPVLSLLPQATLSAMVLVAVVGLIDVRELVRWARLSPVDFWVALTVALVALAAGLLVAVGVGVAATLLLVLRELNTPRLDILDQRGSALAVHVGRGLYTANARPISRAVISLAVRRRPAVSALILDLTRQDALTVTVLDALEELEADLAAHDVVLDLAALPPPAAAVAARVDWYRRLQALGRVHATVRDGMAAVAPEEDV
ncbi:SulP family inorganic anion transporter [Microbacterium elymi]|uniref:SulP family inorganic anion transporter n=1 Tax=Microbacterium elymi TaxID=2909587 RepID=A0ABY5NJJ8_9MICO|nr:SulP family inorganic anion transporter [Microbacterium elymi]UUT35344.1 SulP family inorganic anion transporter [Microbacterium elymi]